MKKKLFFAGLGVGIAPVSLLYATAPLTPEQRGDPNTGVISTDYAGQPLTDSISAQTYGSQDPYTSAITNTLTNGLTIHAPIQGQFSGTPATVAWYKYVADGVTPVIFDMYGTSISFGGNGFGGSNGGSMAVFNNLGQFIASNQSVVAPATGDSYLPSTVSGSPPANALPHNDREPSNPTKPVNYIYDSTSNPGKYWYTSNGQSLPILAFVNNAQSNPNLPNTNPNYAWNQYSILTAGTYFIAVTGANTYYSGSPSDSAAVDADHASGYGGNTTSTTPFGFITFNPFGGVYQLNVRVAGDFDLDNTVGLSDLRLLRLQTAQYKPSAGIPNAGFSNSNPANAWVGLPSDISSPTTELQRYDLTGNSRIDENDIAEWGRFVNKTTVVSITWNNTAATPGTDTLNPGEAGDGLTWDLETSQNFNDTVGADVFFNNDLVTFNDSNNGHYAVTLNATVAPGSVAFNNSTADYSLGGTGAISGTTSLTKTGTRKLTLSTVNNYSGGTIVSGGTLALTVTGALPANSALTIGNNATVVAVNHGANPKVVLETSNLTILGVNNGWTGKLDLTNNDLVAHNAVLGTIANQLKQGFNATANGYWNGTGGIISTAAAGDTRFITTLGYRQSDGASFDGVNTTTSDVLVKYTYYGDADLSGTVTGADYHQLDLGFGAHLTGWSNGDFNYDGVINGLDYSLIDNALNQIAAIGASPLAIVASPTAQLAAVPEPATMGLFTMGLLSLFARRRRRI